ncbi:DUF308 domain-containing protein [Amedibacillus sp. YH-ame10]
MLFTKAYLSKIKWNGLMQSMLWLILGGSMLVVFPHAPLAVTYIAGFLLMIQGVGQLFLFIQEDERFKFSVLSLIHCICACFTGVWALTSTADAVESMYLILAFITFIHGIEDILISYRLRLLHYDKWWIAAIFTTISIGFSLLLIFWHDKDTIYMFTSCNMLLNGACDIWMWLRLEEMAIADMGI